MELPRANSEGGVDVTTIRQAYQDVRRGMSADRVVADPELNAEFIRRCRELGLQQTPEPLNRTLLNARKRKLLTGCGRSRRTSFANEDEYQFAAEIAGRYLERRDGTTVDRIICAPLRAEEFDRLAESVCPGHSPLQYRWALLNMRKRRALRPNLVAAVVAAEEVGMRRVASIDLADVPVGQGVYILTDARTQQVLYVGESASLRGRIEKHLNHSDNRGLAQWLWQHGTDEIFVEWHLLPGTTTKRIRRALETEQIQSRRPAFNIQV